MSFVQLHSSTQWWKQGSELRGSDARSGTINHVMV